MDASDCNIMWSLRSRGLMRRISLLRRLSCEDAFELFSLHMTDRVAVDRASEFGVGG